jgi:hypothetical protein
MHFNIWIFNPRLSILRKAYIPVGMWPLFSSTLWRVNFLLITTDLKRCGQMYHPLVRASHASDAWMLTGKICTYVMHILCNCCTIATLNIWEATRDATRAPHAHAAHAWPSCMKCMHQRMLLLSTSVALHIDISEWESGHNVELHSKGHTRHWWNSYEFEQNYA